jgi:type III pantothenate kinase
MPPEACVPVTVSSVISRERVDACIAEQAEIDSGGIEWVRVRDDLPLTVRYETPERFGADRLANLLYARHAYPGEEVLIIDAGTAIKIDFLNKEGVFEGGVILPDVSMQLRALNAGTAALPLIENAHVPVEFPGTSTISCILNGVCHGTAGAVSHCVDMYRRRYGRQMRVIACGGAWDALKDLVDFRWTPAPDCTLIGTALFSRPTV